MSKRAGPPLFELLRKQSEAAPPAQATPPRRREPDPSVPWTGAGVTRAERSAATLEDEPRQSGELRIPTTRVYLAVALALLLVVAAWAAGHHFGRKAGLAQFEQIVGDEPVAPPVRNPAETPAGPGTTTLPATADQPPAQSRPTQQPPPTVADRPPPSGGPWVLIAGGTRAADPRNPGSNYLELATLPADQAADAIAFLGVKGVRAIAVPVDSGSGAANNPSRYTLVSLGLAVPSGQFRSMGDERRAHERQVAGIGAEWSRERRGGSDFSQTLWRRYDP
jgi:hypothetical protein